MSDRYSEILSKCVGEITIWAVDDYSGQIGFFVNFGERNLTTKTTIN